MAQRNELDRLRSAWRALAGQSQAEGWCTIPIASSGARQLLAGRHFPGNEEAILVGFNSIHMPPDRQLPQGKGFQVAGMKYKIPGDDHAWISLSRQPIGSLDMFARMAEDIVSMLDAYKHVDDQTLFQLFLDRVKAWQEFMHQARAEVLGPEAEIGLVGELSFMRLLFEKGVPAASILDSWQGPLNGLHDFILGFGAIEVKSTVASNGFPATIGSLEQLDASLVGPLFLAGVRFVLDGSGMTLPKVVDDIVCRLGDHPETKAKFESLVLRAGFLRAFSDLYNRHFAHSDTRLLSVDDKFPALTRHNINPAIRKAWYELDLDLVSAHDVRVEMALEELGALT